MIQECQEIRHKYFLLINPIMSNVSPSVRQIVKLKERIFARDSFPFSDSLGNACYQHGNRRAGIPRLATQKLSIGAVPVTRSCCQAG